MNIRIRSLLSWGVDAVSVLLVVGTAVIITKNVFLTRSGQSQSPGLEGPHRVPSVDPSPADLQFWNLVSSGQELGASDAAVTIVVFSDYACGFCVEMNRTLSRMLERYPQHLSVVVKHLVQVSRRPRFKVVLGALCADEQGYFPQYHRAAFESGRAIDYSMGWFTIAESVGLPNLQSFKSCVRSRRLISDIEQDIADAERMNVRVTPTLFVNGERIVGTPPPRALDSMIAQHFVDRRVRSGS